MAALLEAEQFNVDLCEPVVVIGAGPVGVRAVQELRRRAPWLPLVIFGADPWRPYNRVHLSSAFAGEVEWAAVTRDVQLPEDGLTAAHFGCPVMAIDRTSRWVCDALGRLQRYRALVLATGSVHHVPDIPGTGLSGVYTFRDINDAQRLAARRVRSRRTVVLGGGAAGAGGGAGEAEPVQAAKLLFVSAATAMVIGLLLSLFSIPFPETADLF